MSTSSSLTPLNAHSVLSTLKAHSEVLENMGIRSLALFGSVSRNEATATSDLDFLVEFEDAVTFDRYMDLKFFLEDLFNKKIDLVIKQDLKPQIRHTILDQALYVL